MPGSKVVSECEVQTLAANIDKLSINCTGCVGGEFTVDGHPLPDFSKLTIVIEVGRLTRLILEAPIPFAKVPPKELED